MLIILISIAFQLEVHLVLLCIQPYNQRKTLMDVSSHDN
jgi:hypothetical protein